MKKSPVLPEFFFVFFGKTGEVWVVVELETVERGTQATGHSNTRDMPGGVYKKKAPCSNVRRKQKKI